MRWRSEQRSTNVEDRRGMGGRGIAVGGGLGTLLLVVVALFFGADPRQLLEQVPSGAPGGQVSRPAGQPDEGREFVEHVLGSTETTWDAIFRQNGESYPKPRLVLFHGRVDSACGVAGASVGPFYCPADQRVYIDLSFYDDLKNRFRAPGDFAQAYVIAHEVGHHIQNVLGTMDKVQSSQGRQGSARANEMSVRLELQADFYAGVWAHYAARRGVVEPGDIEEALRAASAIGDDRLQMEGQGYVVPDSFTHGSSEQRVRWFRRGYESGDLRQGDTFSARSL